jgi:argininosuccinate lyase
VADLEAQDKGLADVSVDSLKKHHSHFAESDLAFADPRRSLAARSSRGGTAPDRVAEQATRLRAAADHLGS